MLVQWMRRSRCVAALFLLQQVSGSGMTVPWQWTDVFLGTAPKMPPPAFRVWMFGGNGGPPSVDAWAEVEARRLSGGKRPVWEAGVFFGRNPLVLFKHHELPHQSASRLRRMQENYWPLIKEYIDADADRRKKLLDAWIPAIADGKLEAKLRGAIADQWQLEIAPGQRNDPDRLGRKIREGQKLGVRDPKFFFGEAKANVTAERIRNAGDHDDDEPAESSANFLGGAERDNFDRVRDLQRTFGFGYQLLRSCAVDGYELDPYFRQHVEQKWLTIFKNANASLERTLRAMMPPPDQTDPDGNEIGEDSLPNDVPPEKREEARKDRQWLWRERLRGVCILRPRNPLHRPREPPMWAANLCPAHDESPSFVSPPSSNEDEADGAAARALWLSPLALLGPFDPGVYNDIDFPDLEGRNARQSITDAVRSILELRVDVFRLNEMDGEQKQTGGRIMAGPEDVSLYPQNLTLAQKMTFRARRNLIEGERQREDLKIYAEQGMEIYGSALFPFAYNGGEAWRGPVMGATLSEISREVAEDLNTAAQSKHLSPQAKAVAKRAALQVPAALPVLAAEEEELRRKKPDEAAALEIEANAGSACVRFFAWAKRHQVLSRMARLNLELRLQVLHGDGPTFGGRPGILDGQYLDEELVERETPTAVGPVLAANKSTTPDLILRDNPKYTNLFYLLRNNLGRKLEEFPVVRWEDFDEWDKKYSGLVRVTPWEKQYVPPWEWPDGVPPDRTGAGDEKDDYYRYYFFCAVTGAAVAALGAAVVVVLLILECRRSAALQRKKDERQKTPASAEDDEQGVHLHALDEAAHEPQAPAARLARTTTRTALRTQTHQLDVQDLQPPAQTWQALMGLQLRSHSPSETYSAEEEDAWGGRARLLPPVREGEGEGDATKGKKERTASSATTFLQSDSPPELMARQYEARSRSRSAIGRAVPVPDEGVKPTPKVEADAAFVPRRRAPPAPPNSPETGPSRTPPETGDGCGSPKKKGGTTYRN